MWFNVPEARNFLLKNRFVFTLRPKPYRFSKKRRKGFDVLMYSGFGKKGRIYYRFIKPIKNDLDLEDYVKWSGFENVDEWGVSPNRNLYLVVLLEHASMVKQK